MADNMFSQSPMSTYYGFGINPAYTTPAYMSNFRPAYASDTDPFNPYAVNRGYFEALRNQYMFSPTGTYASDPSEDERANNWSLSTMHSDAFVNGITKVGVPLGAWYAANKFLGMKVGAVSPMAGMWDKGSAYARAIYRGQGMGAAAAAAAGVTARQSLGGAMGSLAGRTAGRFAGAALGGAGRMIGLGGALGGFGGALGAGGAVLGGAIGSIAAPIVVGAGVAKGANYYLSEPYIGIRRGEDAMLANTANTFVGGAAAPNMGTFGISAGHANALSRAFMDSNIKDMGFKPGDYSAMADYGMQAGIFNDIGNMNVEEMKKRVEGMADSVKMIMAVANTNSVKEAIQYMSRLKAAGVNNPGSVTRVMSELGLASGVSGTSAEQIMNTVGNQGQMIAQRLGILPIMGQRQAASIYAGFANAYKTGSLHAADVAAMGGVEGATQYVLEGTGRIMSNPYFKAAINSGSELGTGTMLGTMQAYGSRRANNPLRTLGLDRLNFGPNAAKYMENHSQLETVMSYIYDKTANIPSVKQKDGKLDIVAALNYMMESGELSEEEARAIIMQVKAVKDPKYSSRLTSAVKGTADKQMNQWRAQQGYDTLSGVVGIGGLIQGTRQLNRDILSGSSGIGGAFTSMRASMADGWDAFQAGIQGRTREQDRPVSRYTLQNGQQTYETLDIGSYMTFNGKEHRMKSNDGMLRSLAMDSMKEDPDSELGKVVNRLIKNLGKNVDNRADLDLYYRLKKGDVGVLGGTTRSEYREQANRAVQTGRATRERQTAKDLNPKVADSFLTAYVEGITGKDRAKAQKAYRDSKQYDKDSFWDHMSGTGFERYTAGSMDKGDGARVFNATILSMKRTGDASMSDLFDAGGDGSVSFFTEEFGKLLDRYNSNPESLTAAERNRVQEYLALQKMSGLGSKDLESINKGILAQGRGDRQGSAVLYTPLAEKMRENISKVTGNAVKRMDPKMLRNGARSVLTANGYTGDAVDGLDAISDNGLLSLTVSGLADTIRKGSEISEVSRKELQKNTSELEKLNRMFTGENAVKSFGEIADNIGKSTSNLSASAAELSKAATQLSAAAKSGNADPRLSQAIEQLNRILSQKPGGGGVNPVNY